MGDGPQRAEKSGHAGLVEADIMLERNGILFLTRSSDTPLYRKRGFGRPLPGPEDFPYALVFAFSK